MKTVDFYFDYVSPFSWLASKTFPLVRESTGAEFRLVPVLFAGLLDAHGTQGPAENAIKHRHFILDAMRFAQALGLEFEGPPGHPFNPLKALRFTVAAKATEREKLSRALFEACWEQGLDLTDDKVCIDIANLVGLDGKVLLERTLTDAVKNELKQNTKEAFDKGVFGVPSFIVDGELFWGSDRLSLLQEYLMGNLRVDKRKHEEVMSRPRLADRKKP